MSRHADVTAKFNIVEEAIDSNRAKLRRSISQSKLQAVKVLDEAEAEVKECLKVVTTLPPPPEWQQNR